MKELHLKLHERAVVTAKEYLKCETELVGIFQELEQRRTFEQYGMPSLFAYATKMLGLSEATTTALTSIARAASKVPELRAAIEEKKISFSNARRIAPVLKTENKSEWLEKAAKLPVRALELELAKSFPERPAPTKVYAKSESLGRLEVDLPHATLAKLKRAQEILSQKKKTNIDTAHALEALLNEFIERHDPVKKAERTQRKEIAAQSPTVTVRKPVTRPVTSTKVQKPPTLRPELRALARRMGFTVPRQAIPALEKHRTVLRDGARCTHRFPDGSRCESRQWIDLHHIHHRAARGADTAANLRTLCSRHHVTVHR